MSRALLTGSSGFLGRHLKAYLEAQGIQVAGMSPSAAANTEYRIESVHDTCGMQRAVSDFGPDFVFHLAGIRQSDCPRNLFDVNAVYAACLLEALSDHKPTSVVLIGSAAEYGVVEPSSCPLSEEYCGQPVTGYGISKLAQTHLGLAASQRMPVVVVRPFNILGPNMPEHTVVGAVINQIRAAQGQQTAVVSIGDTRPTRDFVGIEDVVGSLLDLAREPNAWGQIVNLCSGAETSIQELVEGIVKLSERNVVIKEDRTRFRSVDMLRNFGENQRLRDLTGRKPSQDIR